MIKIRRSARMTSDMSMSSMSDIAFLLIIFFMVASAFIFRDGLHLVLPDSSQKPVIVKPGDITTITVRENGTLLLDSRETTTVDILDYLTVIRKKDNEAIVMIRVDSRAVYQDAVEIIDTVKLSGITRLSIKMTN